MLPPPPRWESRQTAPLLPDGSAHFWRVPVESTPGADARWRELLQPDERRKLARFHFEEDARREAVNRGALRLLLGSYLGIGPGSVAFVAGAKGKPAIAGEFPGGRIEFNVAHSGEWVVIAFARGGRVGVDVEKWREIEADQILGDFFRPEERQEWIEWPEAEREAAFFRAWTLKEAYLKALGTGLSKPLQSFRVRLARSTEPALISCEDDEAAASRWNLTSLEIAPRYSAAFVSERGIQTMRLFTFGSA